MTCNYMRTKLASAFGAALLTLLAFGALPARAAEGWVIGGSAYSGEATFVSTGTFNIEIRDLNLKLSNCEESSDGRIFAGYKLEEEITLTGCEAEGAPSCQVNPIEMKVLTQKHKYWEGEGIHTTYEGGILTTIKGTGPCPFFGSSMIIMDPEARYKPFLEPCEALGIQMTFGSTAEELEASTYTCPTWGAHWVYFTGSSTWQLTGEHVGQEWRFGLPDPPGATTLSPNEITGPKTTLKGTVNPRGASTTYRFEYGTTTSYGTSVPIPDASAGSGTSNVEVSQAVEGLTANTTYHYRITATNAYGAVSHGEDKTFTTPEWLVQATPEPSEIQRSLLYSASCTSAEACMVVGFQEKGSTILTLAKVKSGGTWSLSSTPNAASGSSSLSDVSCSSASACTAVGTNSTTSGVSTLGERWNGSNWSLQTTPNVSGVKSTSLYGVACPASNYCTAVGSYRKTVTEKVGEEEIKKTTPMTLVEHWDGSTWSIVASPNPEGSLESELIDISCVSTSDCWAVGKAMNSMGGRIALAEHWDGSKWTINSPTSMPGYLSDISCASSSFCVAVPTETHKLARWNGSSWSQEDNASPVDQLEGASPSPYGVSCTSSSACVVTGSYENTSFHNVPFAEFWNGSKWSVQTMAKPGGFGKKEQTDSSASGVSCVSATACTGVGSYYNPSSSSRTLVEERH